MKTKDVALVLSSGGPRGWAYIGAIEELESRGYNITSIAGTSIGSLVGGIYAAGRLSEIKDWLFSLDSWKVFSLIDISLSKNHLVKGDKVIEAIKEIVPEINIEDLNIPYRAIAADLYMGENNLLATSSETGYGKEDVLAKIADVIALWNEPKEAMIESDTEEE